ncbi:MAG: sugar ABC transporter ATP-binding protein [Chloroflexi bacterium]|nr:sugar ABC transporter ATP-binding protein [Chloroflexota bacterium]OJW04137.1 MAG: sugar ABC transporter ATP-binding protein [Chloroflexi bacterium 54-19]
MSTPLLEAVGLVKHYGHIEALRGADFTVYPGEIVALLGDNGAGKSSLIKAICGVIQPDSGQIRFEGKQVNMSSPLVARKLGIETVFQDLALAPDLDPAGNIFLGQEILYGGILGKLGFLNKREMHRRTEEAFARLGVGIQDSKATVVNMSGGQRQGIAVARSMIWASKIILMDEPTAALGVVQSRRVSDLIRRVKAEGIAIVLVSHNLPFVFEIADRIEVMRLGKRVGRFQVSEASADEVLDVMTGLKVQNEQEALL